MIDLPKDVAATAPEYRRYSSTNPLAIFRELSGLTQEQLSEKSGVHRDTIAQMETWSRGMSLDALILLSKAMEVDFVDFYEAWADRKSVVFNSSAFTVEIPPTEDARKNLLSEITAAARRSRAKRHEIAKALCRHRTCDAPFDELIITSAGVL